MEFQNIGIVGAGQMGSGIAQVCAVAGLQVTLRDISEQALERALTSVGAGIDRAIKSGKIDAGQKQHILGRIRTSVGAQALERCDFIIEAASEDIGLKQRLLREIETIVGAEAVIATNTSSVSITRLGASIAAPQRFVGMHFFNPVPAMGLVEVIGGRRTSEATLSRARSLAERIGKTPISVRNAPGFVVNRILVPMINEAIFVLQEGLASAEEIDAGMKLGANHPIGPLALADLIGLDTCLAVMEVFYRDFNDPKYRPAPLLREMVDAGTLGRKTGSGFHQYA